MSIGVMDVVFSFDTTGSMSQVLDEVKGRVSDIVQRLQADIPGFRVGIIAHGDYCDQSNYYVIKTLDLTNSVADVVNFVHETEGTGGGDFPECYELALRHAVNFSWTPGSHRILVVIGDSYPHEPDYPMNTDNIDWREEVSNLKGKNIKIYGVQVKDDLDSTAFFKELTEKTGGQHLKLANMQRICEAIMGVCYREKGPEFFQDFEAEIRHKQPAKVATDLDDLFGTLRREESRLSDATAILDLNKDDGDDMEDENEVHGKGVNKVPTEEKRQCRKRKALPSSVCETVNSKKPRLMVTAHRKKAQPAVPNARPTASESGKDSTTGTRPRRENISAVKFNYRYLGWSSWKLAAGPPSLKMEKEGHWKTVPQCGSSRVLWRRDLLDSCAAQTSSSNLSAFVFEVAVTLPDSSRRRVVSCHVSYSVKPKRQAGILGRPWYRGIFRCVRKQLNKAACNDCRVFIRWAKATSIQRNVVSHIRSDYDYAWQHSKRSDVRDIF